ncbi:hypothetical protein OAS_03950 [Vibrio cyclitrophicus ZF65]|nr:hypothetical protein OAS_03950 [Vibrio cyclitrophicus ZF65]PME09212.1 hypothetical protein BCV42_07590 [Vibrio cyclitrophicus]PME39991.1 hypothetical protein BCV37_03285 [Vibrio cyclitrophicus]PME76536.1 hypothetical protein BCV28_06870 [Vibrio cyclitrophicus]
MKKRVMLSILYLLPILTVAGTFGTYLLVYGTDGYGYLNFYTVVAFLGVVVSCYFSKVLITQFLLNKPIYLGVLLSILGCLLQFASFAFVILMFHHDL